MYIPKTKKSAYLYLRQAALTPFAENVFQKMSTDPKYASMTDLFTLLNQKTTAYQNALTATSEGGILLTAVKDKAKKELCNILNIIANTLDNNANGNELYILEAGMKLQSKRRRTNDKEIIPPTNLVVNTLLQAGTVEVKYDLATVSRLVGVAVEWSPVTEQNWNNGTYFGKKSKKGILSNLPSMNEVLVRVRTICENGYNSDWTEPAKVKVL